MAKTGIAQDRERAASIVSQLMAAAVDSASPKQPVRNRQAAFDHVMIGLSRCRMIVRIMTPHRRAVLQRSVLMAGIIFIGINLRPALASVGPLVGMIRDATGLSNVALGLLTTLPLLGFGIFSTLTPLVTRRLGIERTLGLAMVLLAAGILLRVLPPVWMLFAGTAIVGVAIALGNVLLPSLVKRDFPERSGFMTSIYSSAMAVGASVAAGVSVPLADSIGWRSSLASWSILAVVAFLVWLPQMRYHTAPRHAVGIRKSLADLGRSRIAWQIAVFMGLQSLTFYVILAWLPEILVSRGAAPDEAGWLLSLSQGSGIAGSMLVPVIADRFQDQRRIVVALASAELIAIIGLLLPGLSLAALWVSLIGFVLGGTFSLALLFIVLRTPDSQTATEMSGLAQSVGYLIAATGPTLFGLLHDVSSGWTWPLLSLMLVLLVKVGAGLGAGRPAVIAKRPD